MTGWRTAAAAPLLVAGDVCADIVVALAAPPAFDQAEQLVDATTLVLGGSSAITAHGAARLGVPTAFSGRVGDDPLGRTCRDALAVAGVDVSACTVDRHLPTGSSTILALPTGDRSILTALGTVAALTAAEVRAALGRATYGHVHVGSWFLQQHLRDGLPEVFAAARATGTTTSLDPNFDPAERWDGGAAALLPHVDVLLLNEREAAGLAGTADPAQAVARLLAALPRGALLVRKLGARGADAWRRDGDRGEPQRCVAVRAPTAAVVDAVGAGDSLTAGVLAARLRGAPVRDALAVGVACGTASVAATGGTAAQPVWAAALELAASLRVEAP